MGQALSQSDAHRFGDRDPPAVRGGGFRRRVHAGGARGGAAAARRDREAAVTHVHPVQGANMPSITPYLVFDGNCADAMRFYERVLGGKLERMMTFGDMPAGDSKPQPDTANRIAHARLDLRDGVLMASDTMPSHPYEGI